MNFKVEDMRDSCARWIKSYYTDGIQFNTVSGIAWRDMNSRCRVGGSAQSRRPKYKGCATSENFKDFQYFTTWHINQVGYALDGYHMEKDILFPGNKEYSETSCVLVPSALNMFLTGNKVNKGSCSQGVSWQKANQKYRAEINISGKRKYLGLFFSEIAAGQAYKVAKEAEARRWHERLVAGEYTVDMRVIERMRIWKLDEGLNQ